MGTAQEGHPGSQGHQAAQQGVNTPSRQRLGTVRQVALREMPQRLEVQELRQLHTMLPLTARRICTCLTPLLGVLRLYERGSKTTQDCAHHLTLLSRPVLGCSHHGVEVAPGHCSVGLKGSSSALMVDLCRFLSACSAGHDADRL